MYYREANNFLKEKKKLYRGKSNNDVENWRSVQSLELENLQTAKQFSPSLGYLERLHNFQTNCDV